MSRRHQLIRAYFAGHPRRQLLCCALGAALLALDYGWIQVPKRALDLDLRATTDSFAQVFYDTGHGYNENEAATAYFRADSDFQHLKFPLPFLGIKSIRIDPLATSGEVDIKNITLALGSSKPPIRLSLAGITPRSEIGELKLNGDTLHMRVAPGLNDPQLSLPLETPLPPRSIWVAVLGAVRSGLAVVGAVLVVFGFTRIGGAKRFASQASKDTSCPPVIVGVLNRPVLWCTLCFVAIALFYRKPDSFINPQFWAEDGHIFFAQNYLYGVRAWFLPYAGYLHVPIRITAYLAGLFPFSVQPALYNYSAFVWTLLVVGKLFSPRIMLPYKAFLAGAIVLVPETREVMMSLTGVLWTLSLFLVFLAVQRSPLRPIEWIGDFSILVFTGLGGPFVILLLPLFVMRFVRYPRERYARYLVLTAGIVSAIQVYFVIRAQIHNHVIHSSLQAWLQVCAIKPVGQAFLGKQITVLLDPLLAVPLVVIIAVIPLLLARCIQPEFRWFVFSCTLASAAIYLSTLYRFITTEHLFDNFADGARYYYLPKVLFAWSLIVCLGDRQTGKVALSLLLVMLLASAASYQSPPLPDFRWTEQVERLKNEGPIHLNINPPGWTIDLPERRRHRD